MSIIKHIIMACGCYDEENEEFINKCNTEHCPLMKQGTLFSNGCHVDSFTSEKIEDQEKD